jgi:1-acyl-sn-glycerol-3-phosphate acyltransferase
VVANHQGYADVVTIGGLFPSIFAARHDMRAWPMFGALARSGATIFINRDDKRAAYRGVGQVAAALGAGATVIAFPEGTSTDGSGLLPFRTGVFQAAVDAGAPVVPAAIRYLSVDETPVTEANRDVVGWFRGEPFVAHILRLAAHRRVLAEVTFGEPLAPPHGDRRALAAAAEARVRVLLSLASEARPLAVGRALDATMGGT